MWGKKEDWEERCFFKSKIMGLAQALLIDNSVSLVQLQSLLLQAVVAATLLVPVELC